MGMRASPFNLQFGNEHYSYQDLIPVTIGNTPIGIVFPALTFAFYRGAIIHKC